MATTFFLLLPEALHMIGSEFEGGGDAHDDHEGHRFMMEDDDDHDDHGNEAAGTWRWGASIMGTYILLTCFLTSVVID